MGLTLRQLLCSGIAIGLAVLIYLWAKPLLGQETASWLCILAAAPIAAAGFLSYDGLPFEKFVIIVLESTILCSGWRVWKTAAARCRAVCSRASPSTKFTRTGHGAAAMCTARCGPCRTSTLQ